LISSKHHATEEQCTNPRMEFNQQLKNDPRIEFNKQLKNNLGLHVRRPNKRPNKKSNNIKMSHLTSKLCPNNQVRQTT
jgi:hypothetical protein